MSPFDYEAFEEREQTLQFPDLPEFWQPEAAPAFLKGVVVETGSTEKGPFVRIEKEDGSRVTLGLGAGLKSAKLEEKVGWLVKIQFEGWADLEEGKKVRKFSVTGFAPKPIPF